ncbi:Uncharacterised protein [Mycobacterium tuberculosis]|uniref:Uncharacterized protein n=1 Tax=Mycobacterium tuberculosis TaxID=1773 RepID=A0A654TWW2_MYCTX|nr:Uncharacterised protein [Mycobacterium tuberculosis]
MRGSRVHGFVSGDVVVGERQLPRVAGRECLLDYLVQLRVRVVGGIRGTIADIVVNLLAEC